MPKAKTPARKTPQKPRNTPQTRGQGEKFSGTSQWPANSPVIRKIAALIPFARNSRTHSDEQVAQIAASIKEWGFTSPVLIDEDNGIIAGHGRVKAAHLLGLAELPCIVASGWTDAQKRAYVIADNKLALNAGWDSELLGLELADLQGLGFDLALTGFSIAEIKGLAAPTERGADEDEIPEAPKKAKTRKGDIWTLGEHRLMCGDSTDAKAIGELLGEEKADLTFTSPPYNANTKTGDGDIFTSKKAKKLYAEGYSDNLKSDAYLGFVKTVLNNCFAVTDGFIFWNVSYNANSRFEYIAQILDRLPYLIEQICWKKSSTIPFKGSLMRDWEPIYLFSTKIGRMLGLKKVTSNHWEVSNTGSQQSSHKACFPVALPEKGILLVTPASGIVFDPFGGSGTTLIACEKLNRRARLMELDPRYCDVVIERWQAFTGQIATDAKGKAFNVR